MRISHQNVLWVDVAEADVVCARKHKDVDEIIDNICFQHFRYPGTKVKLG